MYLCSPYIFLLFWLLYSWRVNGQSNLLTAETEAFINQVLNDWNSPGGAAVAVVRKTDQNSWNVETKGYGTATINGTKVTEQTRFAMASNSKLFNILATGLLINNETLSPRISWTSKIASIVPIWGLEDPVAERQATIIDVMSHRTGMPRHDASIRSNDDIPTMITKLKFQRPSADFRDIWQYCNNMYTLLSYLPPLLVNTPLARYVKQHIFDPLGMTSTTYSYDVANGSGQLADGMTRQPVNGSIANGTIRAFPYWSQTGGEDGNIMSGAGGVISNAVDMATWLQTLLLGGIKPGSNISVIPSSAIERVATGISIPVGAATFPELSPVVYGGGQTRQTYRGHELVEHGGDITGFHSQVARLPNDSVGVAVLTNDDLSGFLIMEIIKFYILDAALNLEKIDWNSRYKALASRPQPPLVPRPTNPFPPSANFTSLTGTYANPGYGTFELCLISPKDRGASSSCQALASRAATILPGLITPNVPLFLSEWDNFSVSYISLSHFDKNIFNASGLNSYPTGDPNEPYWYTSTSGSPEGTSAEFVLEGSRGIGFIGIWGAGTGIPSPQGKTVRERAEVWFDKV